MKSIKTSPSDLRLMQTLLFAHSVELKPSTHPKDRHQREQALQLFGRISIVFSRHDSKEANKVTHG